VHDPDFAAAHAGLANSYTLAYITNPIRSDEMLRVAGPAAARALELDPELSEAHSARAGVLEQADPVAAEAAYRRALELKPSNRDASFSYGLFLLTHLRFEEAIDLSEGAIETDPLDAGLQGLLAQSYGSAGRTGEALQTFAKARALDEQGPFAYYAAAFFYIDDLGDLPQGLRWLQKSAEVDPGDPELVAWIAHVYTQLGEIGLAVQSVERARAMDPANDLVASFAAFVHARAGNAQRAEDLALRALRPESVRRLGSPLMALRVLRNAWFRDGRFEELIAAYEAAYPTLTRNIPLIDAPVRMPVLSPSELASAAVEFAHVYAAAGDADAAAALVARARGVFEFEPRAQALAQFRPFTTPIEILILENRHSEALDALEALVDSGWRANWQWHLVPNPIFDPLRDEPRFTRLIERLERDTQRFRLTVAQGARK
jgi:tetratricopeptide (TPR) repeat protein